MGTVSVRLNRERVRWLIHRVLRGEGARRKALTVVFTDDRSMRRLHRRFLGKDRPTDVLAFPPGNSVPETARDYLGDVVVSAETARRVAARYGETPVRECERYVVHGILHLLGYRDRSPREKQRMREREETYLRMRL